jgi:hypothetical protein
MPLVEEAMVILRELSSVGRRRFSRGPSLARENLARLSRAFLVTEMTALSQRCIALQQQLCEVKVK